MDPIELTFNHMNPPGGHVEAATVAFIDYIEEKTEGKVTVQPFYSGSLLPAAEVFSGVGSCWRTSRTRPPSASKTTSRSTASPTQRDD